MMLYISLSYDVLLFQFELRLYLLFPPIYSSPAHTQVFSVQIIFVGFLFRKGVLDGGGWHLNRIWYMDKGYHSTIVIFMLP